jgi:hypothetical protein
MAARSYIRKLVKVNQQKLHRLIETESGVIRWGSAVNCSIRAKQYERDGFSGIRFYARTKNMIKAEGSLLKVWKRNRNYIQNLQRLSNSKRKPGFVYYMYIIRRKKNVLQTYNYFTAKVVLLLNCFNKKFKLFAISDENHLDEF